MNEMQVFQNSEFGQLEVIIIDGKEHFPATECAKLLGYSNPRDAIRSHCKGVRESRLPSPGGMQKKNFIPEGDLYRLIARSQLPAAERFERWVFDEVLPSIRKHGMYATPQSIEAMLSDPASWIKTLQALKAEREARAALEVQVAQKDQIIGELKPKADYVDWVLNNPGLVTITQIAKDYGMSGTALNRILHEHGIQYKQGEQWLLYRKYHSLGYTHSQTVEIVRSDGRLDIAMNTKWTQKGRLFIYELLKKKDILPMIERKSIA